MGPSTDQGDPESRRATSDGQQGSGDGTVEESCSDAFYKEPPSEPRSEGHRRFMDTTRHPAINHRPPTTQIPTAGHPTPWLAGPVCARIQQHIHESAASPPSLLDERSTIPQVCEPRGGLTCFLEAGTEELHFVREANRCALARFARRRLRWLQRTEPNDIQETPEALEERSMGYPQKPRNAPRPVCQG